MAQRLSKKDAQEQENLATTSYLFKQQDYDWRHMNSNGVQPINDTTKPQENNN